MFYTLDLHKAIAILLYYSKKGVYFFSMEIREEKKREEKRDSRYRVGEKKREIRNMDDNNT